MGDLALNIAASGLSAQQAAMETISENLSNANTPGYVSESATLTTAPGGDLLGIGDGVLVTGIQQAGDGLLTANANQTAAASAQSTALQTVLTSAQSSFPVSTTSGLSNDLSNFWQTFDTVDQNPTSLAGVTGVVDGAQTIVTDLQQASSQLTQLQSNTESQLSSAISQANSLLSQVAQLNSSIATTVGSGAPANSLIDQQNNLISQLATSIGAVARTNSNGTVSLSVGGVQVVSQDTASQLNVTGAPGSMSVEVAGSNTTVPVSSGQASGLLAAINQYLPGYQTQLDQIANSLANTVNDQLAQGFTTAGNSGTQATGSVDLSDQTSGIDVTTGTNDTIDATVNGTPYTLTIAASPAGGYSGAGYLTAVQNAITSAGAGSVLSASYNSAGELQLNATPAAGTTSLQVTGGDALSTAGLTANGAAEPLFIGSGASGIQVNPALTSNPQLLAISSTSLMPDATNNGGNAQAIAELSNTSTGPDQAYQAFIQQIGSQTQAINSQVTSQTAVATAAQQNLQSVTGVNTDSEMVAMLSFQESYQASAKLISTVDTMMQSLLQAT